MEPVLSRTFEQAAHEPLSMLPCSGRCKKLKRGFQKTKQGSGGHSPPEAEGYIHFYRTLMAVLAQSSHGSCTICCTVAIHEALDLYKCGLDVIIFIVSATAKEGFSCNL